MSARTLTQFLDRLTALGYGAPRPMRVEPPCSHDDGDWAVLQIPGPDFVAEPEPRTYGGMGWWRHDACGACARRFAESVARHDAALTLRVFRGEEDVSDELGLPPTALWPARTPLSPAASPMA
jgi:hypothetical protein